MARIIAALVFAGLVGACAVSAEDAKPPPRAMAPPTRIPNPEAITMLPEGHAVSTSVIPGDVRRAVVADAAKRFKVAASSVVLARAEQVTWPDASLGCPEPGTMYTQALVPGFRVVAKTTEGELQYHTDASGIVRSCELGIRPATPPPDR